MTKIALIENDQDLRFIIERRLRSAGYEVSCFADATSILDCAIPAPDLFIIDKDIPAIDGLALCKFLNVQRLYRGSPVLMMSSHGIEQRAHRAGASGFLQKPFDFSELLKTIEQIILPEVEVSTTMFVPMRVG
jgi:two-component system nitrogen regulation response regulator GlnG